jgi:Domain of unknown function (DUF4136)
MKHVFIAFTAGTMAIAFASCNVTSHTEKAAGVDFSQYKTFSWISPANSKIADRADNDIVDNNIKNSISAELEKKGWVETDSDPDVLLDYTVAVEKGARRETDPVYMSPYTQYVYGRRHVYTVWYPSLLMGYHSYNVPFKEGELTINMFDAKAHRLIWQGWAKGDIDNGKITTKDATADVKSIFKKFSYPNS